MEKMDSNPHKEIIRASEIGTYMFCNRAWWLRRQNGQISTNITEMTRGTRRHERQSRIVRGATAFQRAGYALVLLSLVFIAVYFILQS